MATVLGPCVWFFVGVNTELSVCKMSIELPSRQFIM